MGKNWNSNKSKSVAAQLADMGRAPLCLLARVFWSGQVTKKNEIGGTTTTIKAGFEFLFLDELNVIMGGSVMVPVFEQDPQTKAFGYVGDHEISPSEFFTLSKAKELPGRDDVFYLDNVFILRSPKKALKKQPTKDAPTANTDAATAEEKPAEVEGDAQSAQNEAPNTAESGAVAQEAQEASAAPQAEFWMNWKADQYEPLLNEEGERVKFSGMSNVRFGSCDFEEDDETLTFPLGNGAGWLSLPEGQSMSDFVTGTNKEKDIGLRTNFMVKGHSGEFEAEVKLQGVNSLIGNQYNAAAKAYTILPADELVLAAWKSLIFAALLLSEKEIGFTGQKGKSAGRASKFSRMGGAGAVPSDKRFLLEARIVLNVPKGFPAACDEPVGRFFRSLIPVDPAKCTKQIASLPKFAIDPPGQFPAGVFVVAYNCTPKTSAWVESLHMHFYMLVAPASSHSLPLHDALMEKLRALVDAAPPTNRGFGDRKMLSADQVTAAMVEVAGKDYSRDFRQPIMLVVKPSSGSSEALTEVWNAIKAEVYGSAPAEELKHKQPAGHVEAEPSQSN